VLTTALENGGQGARDGGRTRGALIRRAAVLTFRELHETDRAFSLLGGALTTHVDPLTLDALEDLAREVGDPRRAEATLSQVLEEVFDGPLVRQLLARRAKLRREHLADKPGAAVDLKKLHDLSPNDQAVMTELSDLFTELGDYRGMVRLYEDQILRGKDLGARAELARKVARMWEEQLVDPREAADAWRRVLRMKQGDPEATEGLERAKSNMLKTLDPAVERRSRPPPAPAPEPKERDAEPEAASAEAADAREPDNTVVDVPAAEHAEKDDGETQITDSLVPPMRDLDKTPPGDLDRLMVESWLAESPAEPASPTSTTTAPPPPQAKELAHRPAAPSDISIDVDMSGEHAAVDEDDIVMADDLAELVEPEPAPAPVKTEPPPKPKRSMPPPLPRG
jgi:hypothetical protein